MAVRPYEFTGVVVESSSLPSVSDASAATDIAPFRQVARRDDFYDSQTNNAGVKAIAAADRADEQVVWNSGAQAFYEFVAGNTDADDGDTTLTPDDDPTAPAGRWKKVAGGGSSSEAGKLIYQLDGIAGTVRAAEALSANDAVALVGFEEDGYLICKAENDAPRFRGSFFGFARSAVTVTQGVYTLTADAAFVTGNVISLDVNGINYSVTYSSSSDETLQALADAISQHSDIDGTDTDSVQVGADKLGSDDRVINVFSGNGKGADGAVTVLIDSISVTGGASQPNLTFATTTPAAGNTVDVHRIGPMSGFTGLTAVKPVYLSNTAGGVTQTAPANQFVIGHAMSTTTILVEPEHVPNPAQVEQLYKSHGAVSGDGASSNSIEAFNFTSWANGPVATNSVQKTHTGESQFEDNHHRVDGTNPSSTINNTHEVFNGASWSTDTARTTAQASGGVGNRAGLLTIGNGTTSGDHTSGDNDVAEFNGSSWTEHGTVLSNSLTQVGCFTDAGDDIHFVAGYTTAAAQDSRNDEWDGTTSSSDTAYPVGSSGAHSGQSTSGGNGVMGNGATTVNYEFNGSSWSSALTTSYACHASPAAANEHKGAASGYSDGFYYMSNGRTNGSTSTTSTSKYNGTSFSSDTASSDARSGPQGSMT